jgi:hypothetical protein
MGSIIPVSNSTKNNQGVMKTLVLTSKFSGLASALIFSSLLAASVQAGQGIQYWQSRGTALAQPTSSEKSAAAVGLCPSSELLPVTTMKAAQANGRGALIEVQIGTKRVCHMCPVAAVTVTNAWTNGRGPSTTVETSTVGPAHNCASGCASSSAKT